MYFFAPFSQIIYPNLMQEALLFSKNHWVDQQKLMIKLQSSK
jgi:hypothetical protein